MKRFDAATKRLDAADEWLEQRIVKPLNAALPGWLKTILLILGLFLLTWIAQNTLMCQPNGCG